MAHTWTWDKLMKNAYRLNPKSRGQNYPSVPKWEFQKFTSGQNRGQKVIVPFVGTKSVLISMRAWGVTQSALHNVTLLFSDIDILKEDPQSSNYFQIEYEGQMYWIQKLDRFKHPLTSRCTCFTGDTEVMLSDGSFKSFKDLEGQEFEIMSYNEKADKYEIVKAFNCEKKKENAELVEILLDSEEVIKCTPDHRFLLRDGNWIQAKDLREDDSLRALYLDKEKLQRILPNGKKEKIKKHKEKEDFYVYVYLDPRYPGKYEYNSCSFEYKPIYVGKGCNNMCWSHLKENNEDVFHNTLQKIQELGLKPIILRQQVKLHEQTAFRIKKQLTEEIGLWKEGKGPLLNLRREGESDKIKQIQEEVLDKAFLNHKVISVKTIEERQDVYCLTAEYLGNFVVKASNTDSNIISGITVANCADYFFTFAHVNYHIGKCLYGPKPRPYIKKTNRPYRNTGLPGICKHIYDAWAILRNSGMTVN